MDEIEKLAKEKYETIVEKLEGHHCPPWDGLSELMKEHLILSEKFLNGYITCK